MERFGIPGVALFTCNRAESYPLEPPDSTGSHARGSIGEVRIKEFLVEHFNFSLPPAKLTKAHKKGEAGCQSWLLFFARLPPILTGAVFVSPSTGFRA